MEIADITVQSLKYFDDPYIPIAIKIGRPFKFK